MFISAAEAKKNRSYPFMDKIFDQIKEVSVHESSFYACFDGDIYPYLTAGEKDALENILTQLGYSFYWDMNIRDQSVIVIQW